jgi:hypothetical protein
MAYMHPIAEKRRRELLAESWGQSRALLRSRLKKMGVSVGVMAEEMKASYKELHQYLRPTDPRVPSPLVMYAIRAWLAGWRPDAPLKKRRKRALSPAAKEAATRTLREAERRRWEEAPAGPPPPPDPHQRKVEPQIDDLPEFPTDR